MQSTRKRTEFLRDPVEKAELSRDERGRFSAAEAAGAAAKEKGVAASRLSGDKRSGDASRAAGSKFGHGETVDASRMHANVADQHERVAATLPPGPARAAHEEAALAYHAAADAFRAVPERSNIARGGNVAGGRMFDATAAPSNGGNPTTGRPVSDPAGASRGRADEAADAGASGDHAGAAALYREAAGFSRQAAADRTAGRDAQEHHERLAAGHDAKAEEHAQLAGGA